MLIDEATGLVFCIQRDASESGRRWRVEMSITYGPPADGSSDRGEASSWCAHLYAGSYVKPLTFHDLLAIQSDLTIGDQFAAWYGYGRPFGDAKRPPTRAEDG